MAAAEETDGRRRVDFVDFEVSNRSENTLQRLYAQLPEAQQYCNDRYAVYAGWFPPGCHQTGKGGPVNGNEGLHWILRSKLNRLARRTKGYANSIEMLACSVALAGPRVGSKSIIPARKNIVSSK